ncbi:sensor histidine kinase [Streptococcus equinus]|uniref:sensor histidine kinase n=1 Tax=Streptococcus equinus TaxID=1335 RepID=UPI00088A78A9|nr:ATP-binding protein [Streptococcus equinus]SDJ07560.1 two-component system, OmpR family, phosphate regulon sensor histidine kinase PhoR [Streptococcus equinus]SEQ00186.1 two-component system, OmpR family, phosphate regulon sensor histidine kinase PhoR [Streptococcus equinus]
MVKKIFRSTLMVTLGILFLAVMLIMGVLYSYFAQVQKEQLRAETSLVAQGVNLEGKSYFDYLKVSGVRMTWIDHEGNVLYDNQYDAKKMDNHANRKEFKEALTDGKGESTRYSSTLTTKSLYLAQRLDNGTVIRLSVTQHSLLLLYIRMFQPFALIIILAITLSIWVARYTAKRIVAPLNDLDLDQPLKNEAYDEISPLLRRIDHHQKALSKQEALLNQKKEEFDTIISKIKEGIILLDAKCQVISINDAAQQLFQTDQTCLGKNILQLTRDLSFNKWLKSGLAGQKQEGIIHFDKESYKVLIRPILFEGYVTGLVILLFDVTEQLQNEQLRHEFTANVSHELKTPLHVISGYSEMLASGMVSSEDTPHFAGKIYKESKRMVQLVEDIIKLSHLDEIDQVPMETLDVYAIAKNVLDSLSTKASQRQIRLQLTGQPTMMLGNPALIHSILYNICDNAITYNRDKGSVEVTITSNKKDVFLAIKDTGLGIPKEEQNRIFERFYRVDKSRSKKVGGTGLGLSIVKHALKLHNATIQVQSQENIGTQMLLTFHK